MPREGRVMQPKVYSLILEGQNTIFLSIQYAYTLEEAFLKAKQEFLKQNSSSKGAEEVLGGAKINLFTIKSLEELVQGTDFPNKKKDASSVVIQRNIGNLEEELATVALKKLNNILMSKPPIGKVLGAIKNERMDKNQMMQMILDTKDKKLFEKNKGLFSVSEQKYLKARLKK